MDNTLALPPGDICCSTGVLYTGKPKGKMVNVGGLQTYISGPNSDTVKDKIILFFPDVHGPFYLNNMLIMDYFASTGYLIIAPDYFEGNPVHVASERPGFDRANWLHISLKKAEEITSKWIDAVITKFGSNDTKYGAVGYCFGAPFVLNICATDTVRAGAIVHPAFLRESHFRNAKQPILVSCAETDHRFSTESRHTSEKILREVKAKYHYQLFSGVEHGFALRGNMEIENERWAKDQSAKGVVRWWDRFMGGDEGIYTKI